ncbi:hypothetical protein ASPWEDRAFT_45182 [Aspergillus wentii DTO 134E9]|uniref:D-xylulose reductase n=1 Tax=Aspergillus wentii DTO 134E9 TaxID=1073089 RepID=A0A1L9R8I5_ASPWE|nr:uncharacterized protein ASPWEDRAFT_45182 [Aspergillus wentii DTO 134E9]OJJ31221.1 hypothetical protein ASPWEDRAFT_45182 [Aspergillus wentii DTO 134E9]
MGHEASGIIHKVGEKVTTLQPGDRVALEPGYPCRICPCCKRGRYNLCPSMMFAAVPMRCHGTLTRFFKLPADYCYKIPEGTMGLDEAVLLEPLAVAVHSVRQVGVKPGDKVVVFGAGTVGILCAAVAREFGARMIVSVDINEEKLEFARGIVVSDSTGYVDFRAFKPDSFMTSEDTALRLLEEHDPREEEGDIPGFDVVIEATGAASCVRTGIHAIRVGGVFVQTGMGKRCMDFPIGAVAEKEIMLRGCFRYGPGDFKLGLQLVVAKKILVGRFITKVVPFEKAADAWETTMRGEGIKTVIRGI